VVNASLNDTGRWFSEQGAQLWPFATLFLLGLTKHECGLLLSAC